MAEQIGIVIADERNGRVRVVTDRKGACGGCQSVPGKCQSCLTSAKLESHAINPISAVVGDVVKISISPANLFKGAAIMYLLPILMLLLGAAGGLWVGKASGWEEIGSVLGGLAGLVAGFWAVTFLGRGRKLKRQMTPTITSVIGAADNRARPIQKTCCGWMCMKGLAEFT